MASYTSGAVYFSGIGNGTDFSSIVDQLKKVESIPKQRMELWKADWQKRYEAFGYVINAVRDAKTALTAFNSPQKFLLKTGSSSQPGVLSVSASSLAADGTHSVQVKQLASNAIWASNTTFATKSASVNTTDAAQDFTYTYKGRTRSVSVPKGTTLEGFANLVNQDKNNPGVKVSIIQVSGGYTFQVQGQESGAAADLNIHPSQLFGGSGTASSTWLGNAPVANPDAAFSTGGAAVKPYTYTFTMADDSTQTVNINGNMTQQDLADAINAQVPDTATFANGKVVFAGVKSVEITAGSDPSITIQGTETEPDVWETSQTATASNTLQSGVVRHNLTYSLTASDGTVKTLNITSDKSMNDLIALINTSPGMAPASAELKTVNGQQYLQLNNVNVASGLGIDGKVQSSSQWSIRHATDAIFKIDNWPQDMVSSSNAVSNVLEGVTLTLTDIGTSQISIAADLESVKKNIQSVLDALNSVIKTVQELTKFNENKQVASIDTNSNTYSPSQFDREKGSVLTGNYGVQLFNTRLKTLTSGAPPGFKNIQGSDIFSGDFISTLSQMGIKTSAEQGDPNYGLFTIAPSGNAQVQEMDLERFEKALTNNLADVVNFFAADDAGSTTSSSFRYAGHIKGITKPGTYNVSYSVDADGNPFDVFINGVRANPSDQQSGVYTVGQAGGATGMSIVLDDFSPGTHSGQISIKQGKIRQMEEFFAAELVYYKPDPKEPMLGEKNGALMILQANYQQIMDNIDKKIEREQTRLDNWERTQRLAFSRLETLLGNYDRSQQNLTSQLKQLAGSTSS